MKRIALILCLCAQCVFASDGTWLVKPDGGQARTWTYVMGPDSPARRSWTWSQGDITIGRMALSGEELCILRNDAHLLVLSPKTGRILQEWDLFEEAGKLPRETREWVESSWCRPLNYYRGSLFSYAGTFRGPWRIVQWPIGETEFARAWEVLPLGRFDRVGDWLLVLMTHKSHCEIIGIDLQSGFISWRTSLEKPAAAEEQNYVTIWPMGSSGQTAHWEVENWKLYFAVDPLSGDVLNVETDMPLDGLLAYPAYSVHLDRSANSVTVLREQEVVQRRHGSEKVLWRGKFSRELRPLGVFAASGNRVFVEFQVFLKDRTTEAEAAGTYVLHRPSGSESHPVGSPVSEFPLRGVVAIDLATGRPLWVTTITAASLAVGPKDVMAGGLDRAGRPPELSTGLPRNGPLLVDGLVIMRPITLRGEIVSHYLVGLDADTGRTAFIYQPPPASELYGEDEIVGFVAAGSMVCFGTQAGRVYGLDLSEIVSSEVGAEAVKDLQ